MTSATSSEPIASLREAKRDSCSSESLASLIDEREELATRWPMAEMDAVRMVGEVYFRNCLLMSSQRDS